MRRTRRSSTRNRGVDPDRIAFSEVSEALVAVLQLESVAFAFGGRELFRGLDLAVQPGERVGLVGPNGVGKTTLLRLAAREIEPDEGRVTLGRATRVSLLRQDQLTDHDGTVRDALLEPFERLLVLRRRIAALERGLGAEPGDAAGLTDEYARLRAEYEAGLGDGVERRVSALASDLDLGVAALDRPVRTLSGGERRRLALAQTLAAEPDLLLLDEPTNHLDVDTLERLEQLVAAFAGTVLVVSHDRVFLDRVCPVTVELSPQGAARYAGPYRFYVAERERRLESERRAYEKEVAERERQEELIRRTVASGGFYSRQAKARIRRLERQDPLEAPQDVWVTAGATVVRPPPTPRSSRVLLEARGVGATRGGRRLFGGVDLTLTRGERVGIVGPNGSGKTTLLRALMGEPDEGEVGFGHGAVAGICGQDLEELHPDRTPVDEIRSVRGDLPTESIRAHLGMLRIRGIDQERRNETFSGGERARVALAKLLAVPRNLLALDEPTNNLDIPAREVLEDALVRFEGAVLVVSHDRYFLERVATRLLHIEDGTVEPFDGTYDELRARVRGRRAIEGKPATPADPAKEQRRTAHRERREQMRLCERLRRKQASLEQEVAALEERVSSLDLDLAAGGKDWEALAGLQGERDQARARLDALLAEWAETSEQLERVEAGEP
jgi:ATP-binding cassette subfamily F protein 3